MEELLPEEPLPDEVTRLVEQTEFDDGSMEFEFGPDEEDDYSEEGDSAGLITPDNMYDNLVDQLDEDFLGELGAKVVETYEADVESNSTYYEMINRGMHLLGLELESDNNVAFEGACTAYHPLITEAAVKYAAKAIQEVYPPSGPVKTQIIGQITEEKEKQAKRVKDFMNYQITEVMPAYFESTEQLLFYHSVMGSAFKKVYYDDYCEIPVSDFLAVDHVVIPANAPSLAKASRITHVIFKTEEQYEDDIESGLYAEVDLGSPSELDQETITKKANRILGITPSTGIHEDEGYVFLEQHRNVKLPENLGGTKGRPVPCIVTVERNSQKVVALRRNWSYGDSKKQRREHFVHYPFVPGFSIYGLGYIHLLGNFAFTLTTIVRSLVDSGQFANMQGGFKAKGIRILGDDSPIAPGQFKDVEGSNGDVSKSIMPLPFKEPSQVLFQMLQFLEARGQKFADSTESVVSDSTNYGPVGTTLALLEASTKFFSAIHKRLHQSQRSEFKILARINSETLDIAYPYDVMGESRTVFRSDFDSKVDVIPVSDPNITSNAHRLTLAETRLRAATASPQALALHDLREVYKDYYLTMGVDNLDKILPEPEKAQPLDPFSDILALQKGKPIQAFPGQNHDAHIQFKTAFMQDPNGGASPLFQPFVPTLTANIQEHMLLKYQAELKAVSQSSATAGNEEFDMAIAAQQLQQTHQQLAQLQANGGATDPAQTIAKAELMKAQAALEKNQIDAREAELDYLADLSKIEVNRIKEFNRMLEVDKKNQTTMATERMRIGAELLKDSLSNAPGTELPPSEGEKSK